MLSQQRKVLRIVAVAELAEQRLTLSREGEKRRASHQRGHSERTK
jgi:hypothetical protein